MEVTTTVPQTLRGLLAVALDMAKVLPVVALRKTNMSPVEFCLNDNMVKAIQLFSLNIS
jgi:hypothetical protein